MENSLHQKALLESFAKPMLYLLLSCGAMNACISAEILSRINAAFAFASGIRTT